MVKKEEKTKTPSGQYCYATEPAKLQMTVLGKHQSPQVVLQLMTYSHGIIYVVLFFSKLFF